MTRTTCALVAAAVTSLVPLGACGSLSKDTTEPPRGTSAASPTVAGTAATMPTSGHGSMPSMNHTPIPANTNPVSAEQIYQTSRKGVFLAHGTRPDGSSVWGTAFIHDLQGEVAVTTAHVVDGTRGLRALFFDGTEQPLEVVGSDPCTDLAVVHVGGALPEGSVRLPLGDAESLAPGDDVTAVGYPENEQFGAARAVATSGVVQDLDVKAHIDPSLPDFAGAIQHGAALQPGYSGGPLIDNKGNVVGVNSLAGSPDTRGQYFSIPINTAHQETDKLMTGENVNSLGWTVAPHVSNRARPDVEDALQGAGYSGGMFVVSIEPGSPVDGRVQVGDLVSKLGNTPVNNQQDLCDVVESTLPGRVMTADGIHVFSKPTFKQFHAEWRMPAGH